MLEGISLNSLQWTSWLGVLCPCVMPYLIAKPCNDWFIDRTHHMMHWRGDFYNLLTNHRPERAGQLRTFGMTCVLGTTILAQRKAKRAWETSAQICFQCPSRHGEYCAPTSLRPVEADGTELERKMSGRFYQSHMPSARRGDCTIGHQCQHGSVKRAATMPTTGDGF